MICIAYLCLQPLTQFSINCCMESWVRVVWKWGYHMTFLNQRPIILLYYNYRMHLHWCSCSSFLQKRWQHYESYILEVLMHCCFINSLNTKDWIPWEAPLWSREVYLDHGLEGEDTLHRKLQELPSHLLVFYQAVLKRYKHTSQIYLWQLWTPKPRKILAYLT